MAQNISNTFNRPSSNFGVNNPLRPLRNRNRQFPSAQTGLQTGLQTGSQTPLQTAPQNTQQNTQQSPVGRGLLSAGTVNSGILSGRAPQLGATTQKLIEASQPNAGVTSALNKYNAIAQNVTDLRKQSSTAQGGYLTGGLTAPVAQGRAQIVGQTEATQEQALGAQQQAALQSAQTQIQAQAQQQAGLGAAASQLQPQQVAPGSTLVTPIQGNQVAGGIGGYTNYITAQQVLGLISSYPDSGYVYDNTKSPQDNLQTFQNDYLPKSNTYQQGLVHSGYIPGQNTSVAQAASNRSYNEVIQKGTSDISNMQGTLNAADKNAQNLSEIINNNTAVNSTDIRSVNNFLNSVGSQFNNPATLAYNALMGETRALYASVLMSKGGTTPTDAFSLAGQQFPNGMPYDTFVNQYKVLKNSADIFISSTQDQVSQAQNALQSQQGQSQSQGQTQGQQYTDATTAPEGATIQLNGVDYIRQGNMMVPKTSAFNNVGSDTNQAVVTIPQSSRLAFVNNNPGNLKYAGQVGATRGEGGFAKFNNPQDGFTALKHQIQIDTNRGLTLSQFINKYAPQSENNTNQYIQNIVNATGAHPDSQLQNIPQEALARAMAQQESNTQIS